MNDTFQKMEEKYFELLILRSGEERLNMGASMYDTAKEIVKSSILEEDRNITSLELKKKIFLRFYGHEFSEPRRQKILEALEYLTSVQKTQLSSMRWRRWILRDYEKYLYHRRTQRQRQDNIR